MTEADVAPKQLHPWWYRLIKLGDRLAERAGVSRQLEVERLLKKAQQKNQRAFDNCSFLPALEALVDSANREAQLNGFGRLMLTALIGRYLNQRLQLEQWREDHPQVAEEKISRPLFIAGLPRTGTTFLHQLLSQDEQFRAPRTFEIDRPVPPPLEDAVHVDRRVKEIQRGIDVIHQIVPHFKAIHPLGAILPDECQQITAYQFSSIAYQHIIEVPSFRRWILEHDFTEDLLFHRGFLQHLQSAWQRKHWLLKSPAHIQYLPALLKVYPDAMIIQTHRDPGQVMASTTSLSWTMQSVFCDKIDKKTCGTGQLNFFRETLKTCLADRETLGKSDAIFDMNYSSFIDDPMDTVETIYQKFGLTLTQVTRDKMHVFLADNRQHKYGGHSYTPVEFGLVDMESVPEFIQYRQRFSL